MRSFFRPSASPTGNPDIPEAESRFDGVGVVPTALVEAAAIAVVAVAVDEEEDEEEEAMRLATATHSSTICSRETPSCFNRLLSFVCTNMAQNLRWRQYRQRHGGRWIRVRRLVRRFLGSPTQWTRKPL